MRVQDGRDTLFPGRIRIQDLLNPRFISRKPIYDFLVEKAKIVEGRFLDFGCGSMQYKSIFVEKGKVEKYEGLDVESANDFGLHADNITYYDGVNVPFEDETFDAVMAVEVFEHVEHLDDVLAGIYRVMKRNGILIATMPMTYPLHMSPYDYRRFTKYGLEAYLMNLGFTKIEIQPSTTMKSTIRRMKMIQWEAKTPRLLEWRIYKLYVLISNLMFIAEKKGNMSMPIDWLVICKKESD